MAETAFVEDVLAPSCKIEEGVPMKRKRLPTLVFSPSGRQSPREGRKTGRGTILPENDRKSFRMISLQKMRQQLPWIDILTKNTRGGVYTIF
jgi:hypothetical protein